MRQILPRWWPRQARRPGKQPLSRRAYRVMVAGLVLLNLLLAVIGYLLFFEWHAGWVPKAIVFALLWFFFPSPQILQGYSDYVQHWRCSVGTEEAPRSIGPESDQRAGQRS